MRELAPIRGLCFSIELRRVTFPGAVQSGQIKVAGQAEKVDELFSLFDTFNPNFEIVEPKKLSN
jgi:linear primary-alkylsulfatase